MTVAELLAASRAAHGEYRTRAKAGKKLSGWDDDLWDALKLRRQAHEADPTHADPAWAEDPAWANHDALTAFYERQLGLHTTGG